MTAFQRDRQKFGNALRAAYKVGLITRMPNGLGVRKVDLNQSQFGMLARLERAHKRLSSHVRR